MHSTLRCALAACFAVVAACGTEPAPEAAPEVDEAAPELRPLPTRPDAVPAPAETRSIPSTATMDPTGRFASRVLVEGTGEAHPGPYDGVTIHYTGWRSADGHMFDNTRAQFTGDPPQASLPDLFPALREGIQLMVVGETRRFWFPQEPPEAGMPPNRPEGLIAFDVELLALRPARPAPEPLAEPPANAIRLPSGVAYVVVEAGAGTEHPTEETRVVVEYAGWSVASGELFGGTHTDGRPWRQEVRRMIPGLAEVFPRLVVGDRAIVWVPGALAYDGSDREDVPRGTLVFDLTLVRFD